MVPIVMTKLVSWWLFPANQYAIIGVHHPSRVYIENLRVVMMPTLSSLVAPWCHLWWQSWHHDDFIFSVSVCHNREHHLSGVCTKNWELLWCQLGHHWWHHGATCDDKVGIMMTIFSVHQYAIIGDTIPAEYTLNLELLWCQLCHHRQQPALQVLWCHQW